MTIQPAAEVTEDSFEEEVLRSPLPVLVDFRAQWCPPCRTLALLVDEIAAEKAGTVKVVRVNVDDNPALTRRYLVQSVPLMLIFKDGQLRDRIAGMTNKEALLNRLAASF